MDVRPRVAASKLPELELGPSPDGQAPAANCVEASVVVPHVDSSSIVYSYLALLQSEYELAMPNKG